MQCFVINNKGVANTLTTYCGHKTLNANSLNGILVKHDDETKSRICSTDWENGGGYKVDNPQAYRVYDVDGIAPTLTAIPGGASLVPHILVKHETDTNHNEKKV